VSKEQALQLLDQVSEATQNAAKNAGLALESELTLSTLVQEVPKKSKI
jgi:hypothetical protein